MYDLQSFGLRQMIESSQTLRKLGRGSLSIEEAANQIIDFLFESFLASNGNPACALVRCFKTHPYGDLPGHLRDAAKMILQGAAVSESMPCLILLATRGILPQWNSRHASSAHQVIPLATADMVSHAPMIANLVQQMGLQPTDLLATTTENLETIASRTLDVFHIEHALGSVFVPAQALFVQPYGIRSVLGFGGMLPTGELFFVILFTTVPISKEAAAMFRILGLSVKIILLEHMGKPIFAA